MDTIETRGINVPTDLGTVVLTVTDPQHMHVETPNDQHLTVRGVRYRLSLHLNLYDGVWSLSRNQSGRPERHYLTLTKLDCTDWNKKDASDSARDKVLEVVAAKINEWGQTKTAAQVLAQLRFDAAKKNVDAAEGRIQRLTEELKLEKDGLPAFEQALVAAERDLKNLTK